MFDKIANDPYIKELYNNIAIFEDETGGEGYHNYHHVKNVTKMVDSILTQLNYDKEFIENAKIAAILHDIGSIEGKANHPLRSLEASKKYFADNNIHLKYEDEVFDAILNHSDGFDSNSIMTVVLVFADKIDIKCERLAKAGYQNIGARQMQYIKDILVDIKDKELTINFIADEKIDMVEYNNWYFLKKVFKAIESFSNKLGFNYVVKINNVVWDSI